MSPFTVLALLLGSTACGITNAPGTGPEAATGGSAAGGTASGGTASGGAASGGTASGGAASGGAASGGAASGGADGSGGSGTGGVTSGGDAEFLITFPRRNAFGGGQPLGVTPSGSVITVGPKAPPEILPEASGEPFVAEYGAGGEVLHKVAFPGTSEAEMMGVDDEGSIFLVGQLHAPMTFGEFDLPPQQNGLFLVKLAPDFSVVDAAAIELEGGTPLTAFGVDAEGDVVMGLGIYSSDATVQKPQIKKFSGETLEELWSTTFEHDISQGYTIALTFTASGEVLAGGAFTGVLTIGETVLTKAGGQDDPAVYNGWLAWLDPNSGDPLDAIAFGGAEFDYVRDVKATPSGRLLLLAAQTDDSTFLDHADTFGDGATMLYDFEGQESVNWGTAAGGPDSIGNAIAVGAEGQTYVAGRWGWLGLGEEPCGSRLTRVEADGTLGDSMELASENPNGLSHVVVDPLGGVWVSGAFEASFEFAGTDYVLPAEGGQFVARIKGF